MIGKSLGHYEILEKVGQGGMGEVYRARDTKLDREVALKLLPAEMAGNIERRQRFMREAKAIAAVDHPNIVTIHSVEEDGEHLWLTMELIRGMTLDASLPPSGLELPGILEIALPLLDAVSFAHERGITHRDLKPSNIMINEHGTVKVLDFGLAKLFTLGDGEEGATLADDLSATQAGKIMGTVAYMSPEQAEGLPVDPRSDIFSLGIILYEMASGQRPFQGATSISTISAILKDHPRPVTELNRALPTHLSRVIQRCLAKEPSKRYQVTLDLKNELEGIQEESQSAIVDAAIVPSSPPRSVRPFWVAMLVVIGAAGVFLLGPWGKGEPDRAPQLSRALPNAADPADERIMIAVLPFENLGLPEDSYFAGGVTEELITRLSSVTGLGVISKRSVLRYGESDQSIGEIGAELGVDYIVDGSVRWQKGADGTGRVRVAPRLIRVSDDTNLWTTQYDKSLVDIFEVQSSIASEIVSQLGTALSLDPGAGETPPTESIEAYRLYLQAREILESASRPEQTLEGMELLREAIALDPDFALARAGHSIAHSQQYFDYTDRSEQRLIMAREEADRALALAPELPEAHLALGYYYYWGRQDYDQALESFARAGKNTAETLSAVAYIKRRQGNLEESTVKLEQALKLSPNDYRISFNLAVSYTFLRNFEASDSLLRRSLSINQDAQTTRTILVSNRLYVGDVAGARDHLGEWTENQDVFWVDLSALLLQIEQRHEEAIAVWQSSEIYLLEWNWLYEPRPLKIALLSSATDNRERTRVAADSARVFLETQIESHPRDPRMRSALGLAYALLGDKEKAIREGRLAADLNPVSRDHVRGWNARIQLARIYAFAGEEEAALDILEKALTLPCQLTREWMKISPDWRPLRNHPRFQQLVEPVS